MARPRIPFEESATKEVYDAYRAYVLCEDDAERAMRQEGFYFPNPHWFWESVLKPQLGYDMPWGSFQYHWQRLQIQRHPVTGLPYIMVDDKSHAVTLPDIAFLERRELDRLRRLEEKENLRNLP